MDSSQKRLKSLKDTLLEYAVLNVDLLLPDQRSKSEEKVKLPMFPNYLFEEILEMSKNMCWSISTTHLLQCIAARDRLKLSETSCFRFIDDFSAKNLDLITDSMGTLKTLTVSVHLNDITDLSIFNEISRAADTLEDLDLTINMSDGFRRNHTTNYISFSEEIKFQIGTLPNLNRFRLSFASISLDNFPYFLDADRLKVLELCYIAVTRSFLEMLAGFKRLVRLSLCSPIMYDVSLGQVIDASASLKELRSFTLSGISETTDEKMLNKITTGMEKLEILELGLVGISVADDLLAPRRKLKVLNYRCLLKTSCAGAKSALACLAQRVGNYENLSSLMALVSTTPTRFVFFQSINDLLLILVDTKSVREMLREAERNGAFNFRSHLRLIGAFHPESSGRKTAPHDLLMKMTCYSMTKSLFYPFIESQIGLLFLYNRDSHLAKRLERKLRTGY